LKLDSLSGVYPIGTDIHTNKKWHILACGKKDGKSVQIVISIDASGSIKVVDAVACLNELEISNAVSNN
jgi:predicted metal-dependent peptidase